jgi:Fe-S-cluster formation regulator IscX/YfhJ
MSGENYNTDAEQRAALEQFLEKSRSTDIPVLLQAKEAAKQMVRKEPSSANVAALARVTAMLEEAEKAMSDTDAPEFFKKSGEVLRYLFEEKGKQIGRTKLYEDIKSGLLRKGGGKFRRIDVDKYAASLPLASTPDGRVVEAEERQRRGEEAEIRVKEARASREERKNAILEGQYVPRADVDQELAARAATLNQGLKSKMEAVALDLVNKVGGKPKRARTLVQELEKIIDAACAEYAQLMEFEVTLYDFDDDDADSDENI